MFCGFFGIGGECRLSCPWLVALRSCRFCKSLTMRFKKLMFFNLGFALYSLPPACEPPSFATERLFAAFAYLRWRTSDFV